MSELTRPRLTLRDFNWSTGGLISGSHVLLLLALPFYFLSGPPSLGLVLVSVALLLDEVWGDEQTEDATVRSTVRHLRRKLKDAGMGELAEAIRRQRGHYGLMLKILAK